MQILRGKNKKTLTNAGDLGVWNHWHKRHNLWLWLSGWCTCSNML